MGHPGISEGKSMNVTRWRNKHTGTLADVRTLPQSYTVGVILEVVIYGDLGPEQKLADYSSWIKHWEVVPIEDVPAPPAMGRPSE